MGLLCIGLVASFSREIWQQCATVNATLARQCETQDGGPRRLDYCLNKLLYSYIKTLLFLSIFLHLTFPLLAPKPDYTTKPPEPPGTLYRRVCLQSLYHEHGGYSRCENGSSQLHFKQQNTATEFILQLRYAHHHPHLLQPPCCTEGSDTCCLQMFGLSVTHS